MNKWAANLERRQSLAWRCVVAISSVALAFSLTEALQPVIRPTPLFFLAVIISTWYGGLVAGLLASLLGVMAIDWFFFVPIHSFKPSLQGFVLLLIFVLSALLGDYERKRRRRAEASLRRALEEMDATVQERTQAVATANVSLQAKVSEQLKAEAALSKSEQRYRELFENANDMVYTLDIQGNLTGLNKAGEQITGYTRDEMMGKPIARLINPEHMARMQEMMQRKLAGESLTTYEIEITAKDGHQVMLEVSSRLIYESGNPAGIQGTARDITERKQAEEALRLSEERYRTLAGDNARLYKEAQEANRLKDDFLATVSHELRTPLNAIMGWSEMLRTGRLDEETKPAAYETIVRNARSQAQIIDDILDVSRIITGKLRLNVEPVDLAAVVNDVIETVRPAAVARNITLDVTMDESAGAVSGDGGRLQQVIWNLLSNALKFTPENGRIEVRLDRDGSEALLTVRDNGLGIKPEFLPHVFDRFRQADSSYTRQHGGLGLGLAIVRHLVEMHGGTVTAESEGERRGAAFTVRLPFQSQIADDSLQAEPAESASAAAGGIEVGVPSADESPAPQPAMLNGLWLLVVDDDRETLALMAAALGQHGAQVTVVASAAEALAVLSPEAGRQWPDMLLSDIGMPEEDGLGLIQRIRASAEIALQRMPAIALTAYARAEDRALALEAGFHMHIAKPFDTEELIHAIAALAEQHHNRAAQ